MGYFKPVFVEAELTEQQWRVLRALGDSGESDISSIADACYLLQPSMSGILKRLESRDLISRKVNSKDQRSSLIKLTANGKKLIKHVSPRLANSYEEIQAKIGIEQLSQLYQVLSDIEAKLRSQ